jgi:uncharacterized membrane protein YkvA (DUF1232 family)
MAVTDGSRSWLVEMPANIPGGGLGVNPLRNIRFLTNLPRFLKLTWRLFTDKRVWLPPKIILVLGLFFSAAYVILPIDLIPDWTIPGLGLVDDTMIIGLALFLFMKLCPRNIVREHVEIIDQEGKPLDRGAE